MPSHEIVPVPGQLIIGNRQEFKTDLSAKLAAGKHVIVDFAATGYLDSSGLGVLYALTKQARRLGQQLIICNLNEDLLVLMELTKLDTELRIATDVPAAVAALSGG